MAKIKFKDLVERAHGKVNGSSNVSYRRLYGTDHTYTWDKDKVMRPTPKRRIQREAMRLANIAASEILKDEQQTALWKERFEAQSKYRYFRSFIVAMKMAEVKRELGETMNS